MLNPIFWKKVQGQKHPGRWGIVEHQIPSIKVLFKTNAKSHKHPGIKLLSSESKTQLVNQRKQIQDFSRFKILLQRKKVNMTTYFNDNDNINHSPQRGLTPPAPPGVCIPFSYTSFNHLKQKQLQKKKEKKSGNKITYLNARNTYRRAYIYIYI